MVLFSVIFVILVLKVILFLHFDCRFVCNHDMHGEMLVFGIIYPVQVMINSH